MEILRTQRLSLQTWTATDLAEAVALWGSPTVMAFLTKHGGLQRDEIENRLRLEISRQESFGIQYWKIVERATGEFVGCCGLRPSHENLTAAAELGFHLIPDNWGKGYATEAATAAVQYAFVVLRLTKLFAGHHPHNVASCNVLTKLGFQQVGEHWYEPTGLYHPWYRLLSADATAVLPNSRARNAPSLNIVAASSDDLDDIMRLVRTCLVHLQTNTIHQWDDTYPTQAMFAQDIVDGTAWVAKVDDVCRGVVVLNTQEDAAYAAMPWQHRHGKVLVVHRLAVDPAAQGQGIASRLMDFGEVYAQRQGYSVIRLDAFRDNPRANKLYVQRGYRVVGEIRVRKDICAIAYEKCIRDCP
jgi:ribosomal-protein-alanine N-acetyltransferase